MVVHVGIGVACNSFMSCLLFTANSTAVSAFVFAFLDWSDKAIIHLVATVVEKNKTSIMHARIAHLVTNNFRSWFIIHHYFLTHPSAVALGMLSVTTIAVSAGCPIFPSATALGTDSETVMTVLPAPKTAETTV